MKIKKFFENLNFSFGSENSDIKPFEIVISENNSLTERLQENVFSFEAPEQVNGSFCIIYLPLVEKELFEVRRFIWNQNQFDLYFLTEQVEPELKITLYYAKNSPKEEQIKISDFRGNEEDIKELEKIKKSNFESGAFWLLYSDVLDRVKKSKKIDIALIEQLKQLKNKLKIELDVIKNKQKNEIVQALIDRTLFIKFLEDNHIINSFFYQFHFPNRFSKDDIDFGYKRLLLDHDKENINRLFIIINELFNNILFQTPTIPDIFWTDRIFDLLYQAIRQEDWKTGQLSLFDFRFDIIPIEFISHIYEVFLEDKQLEEGIYYTPNKLADLIIDDTIISLGKLLDPACGSGMFLVLAFRKFLEYRPVPKTKDINAIIEHKSRILSDYIYGIEKENTAWRLCIFSLYLEILKGISPEDIKEYVITQRFLLMAQRQNNRISKRSG